MNQRMAATAANVSERASIASFMRDFQLGRRPVHQRKDGDHTPAKDDTADPDSLDDRPS
jgi:hypothetical protein